MVARMVTGNGDDVALVVGLFAVVFGLILIIRVLSADRTQRWTFVRMSSRAYVWILALQIVAGLALVIGGAWS